MVIALQVPTDASEAESEPTVNHVELTGYLGADPELRYSVERMPIARASLATHAWHEEHEQLVRTTDWHRLVAFGTAAETMQRLRRGELVQVSGRLHTHSWVDAARMRHTRTEIIADQIFVVRARHRQAGLPLS